MYINGGGLIVNLNQPVTTTTLLTIFNSNHGFSGSGFSSVVVNTANSECVDMYQVWDSNSAGYCTGSKCLFQLELWPCLTSSFISYTPIMQPMLDGASMIPISMFLLA
jgi:hypothetical protein